MKTEIVIHPLRDSLEMSVKASLAVRDQLRRDAAARAAVETALVTMAANAEQMICLKEAADQKKRLRQAQFRNRPPVPMPAVRLGRMIEEAWSLLSDKSRENGLPLWKLAALANLHTVPVPAPVLDHLVGNLICHQLVREDRASHHRIGWCLLRRVTRELEGIKLYDHEGRVLVAVGQMPCGEFETRSPFTHGILDGQDQLPRGWIYRTKDKVMSQDITKCIAASLPLRQSL